MNSRKEDKAKIKELERNEKELKKQLSKWQEKYSVISKETTYLKQRVNDILLSRNNWKAKLKKNREELKQLKLEVARTDKAKGHHYTNQIIVLCVLLRIIGGCSYGSIVKILGILNDYFHLGLEKIPCENTIQNWVSKLGLCTLQKTEFSSRGEQVSLIIDESIRLGQEKLLLVLSVPYEKIKQGALSFQDVEVVFMKGALSWTGEKISKVVETLKQTHGFDIKSIVSDEDSKLLKACRLSKITHIPDISHAVATCLKRVFEKTEEFKSFKALLSSYSSKGVNQALSYLCSPKQRTKARFMNLDRIVKWGNRLLGNFHKLNETEKKFFIDLPAQADFINTLKICLSVAKTISLPFKLNGLNKQTLREAKELIISLNIVDGFLGAFLKELQGYLSDYEKIIFKEGALNLHVSSEIIESMFGKYKSKASNYALIGLTSLNLELPIYGMQPDDINQQMEEALESISIAKLNKWKEDNSTDNQSVKRQEFFKNEK